MKKLLSLLIICTLVFSINTPVFANNINVFIDGNMVQFTNDTGYPFIDGGRTLVPLRITMESFGATVEWEESFKTAIVRLDTTTVRCKIDEIYIYRNNVKIANDAAAVIVNGRTYLPIRAVLESFGATVSWDGAVRVTSPTETELIYNIENTPSIIKNYWPIWNEALTLKNSGKYKETIDKIMSISKVFLDDNTSASDAMLFKHLGECYSNLNNYQKASACFKREAYYWSLTPGMEQSRIDAERRSNLIKTATQLYVKSTDKSMGGRIDFGVKHEPEGGIYIGAYAEGDANIHNPYDVSKFYMDTFPLLTGKDMSAYLLYLPYGQSVNNYASHIVKAAEKNKIIQIALEPHEGLQVVNSTDGYLVNLAKDMQNANCKMMLRFAGEMNDTTSKWFTTDTNQYIDAFRTVASVFHTYAPDVPVIWAPNFYPADTMDDYYPGDEYVDYVGISSYKMHQPITDPLGQGVDRSRWSNQLDTIYSLYGHKKPIIVVEGGASYMDYDTWADITPFASQQIQDFYTYLPIKYPNVKMCFVFDSDATRQKYTLSNNDEYLSGYKKGIESDLFVGHGGDVTYSYDYYELGNNVSVKAENTELLSYIVTPDNSVSYVTYSINETDVGTAYSAPYAVQCDFSVYKGQKVNIRVRSFNANNVCITDYVVSVNVQ